MLLLGFEEELEEEFNSPSKGNPERLNSNVVALVNTLTRTNLEISHIKRESNYVKLTEFGGTEAEDSNKWLE